MLGELEVCQALRGTDTRWRRRGKDLSGSDIVGPPSDHLSTFSEHEVVQSLYATQLVLGHVLGPFVNLAHH